MGLMDQAGEFLKSEQGEQISDQGIQAGADALNNATGGKYADQIAQGAQFADDKIGQQVAPAAPAEGEQPA